MIQICRNEDKSKVLAVVMNNFPQQWIEVLGELCVWRQQALWWISRFFFQLQLASPLLIPHQMRKKLPEFIPILISELLKLFHPLQ